MTVETVLSHPIVPRLGWTLVHFVWQGAAVAVLLAVVMLLLRRRSANARYVAACTALLLMAALPLITMQMVSLPVAMEDERTAVVPASADLRVKVPSEVAVPASVAPADYERSGIPRGSVAVPPVTSHRGLPWWERASQLFEPALPWVVCGWLVGVLALSLRLLGGWVQAQRLKRRFVRPASDRWREVLADLARRLRVSRPVRLMESTLARVPTVVGWFRPVILLPAGVMTGLSPQQVEALTAHELAHIRRYDYLVNLLQTVIETLLFYHPAVWWVSHRIRVEREHCCDDLAVAACGDAVSYARALTELEQLRGERARLAVASSGGSLIERVRRLVGASVSHTNRSAWWLAGAITLTTIVVLGMAIQIHTFAFSTEGRSTAASAVEAGPSAKPVPGKENVVEGEFALGFPITIALEAREEQKPKILDGPRIQFNVVDDRLQADLHITYESWPHTQWLFTVEVLDAYGTTLSRAETIHENTGTIARYPLREEETIHFDLGRIGLAHADKFRFSIESHWSEQGGRQFELAKECPLSLELAGVEHSSSVRLEWFKVQTLQDGGARATLHAVSRSWPKMKWRISVGLSSDSGQVVGRGDTEFENSAVLKTIPHWEEQDLNFNMHGPWQQPWSGAKGFNVRIERFAYTSVKAAESARPPRRDAGHSVKPPSVNAEESYPLPNEGLSFDGVDDFLEVADSPTLDIGDEFTVEAWVRVHEAPGERGILSKEIPWKDGYVLLVRGLTERFCALTFAVGAGDHMTNLTVPSDNTRGTGVDWARMPGVIEKGKWHHVAASWARGTVSLFVDGQRVGMNLFPPAPPARAPLTIGQGGVGIGRHFDGDIAEIRIWKVARNEEEIRKDMRRELTGSEPGLVACWAFDEGSGQIAHDISTNDLPARLGASEERDGADPSWTAHLEGKEASQLPPDSHSVQYPTEVMLILLDRAEQLYATEKFEEAIEAYQELHKEYPNWNYAAHALMMIGICYGGMGREEEALTALEKAAQEYPDLKGFSEATHFYLGVSYVRAGQKEKAHEEFRKSVELCQGVRDPDKFPWKDAKEWLQWLEHD